MSEIKQSNLFDFQDEKTQHDVNIINSPDVTLSGRNVEEILMFNGGISITDTGYHNTGMIDFSKYKQVLFIAVNTLNQPVQVFPGFDSNGYDTYYYDKSSSTWKAFNVTNKNATIPATNPNPYLLNTLFAEIDGEGLSKLKWTAKCATAPTTGALMIKAWGVIN